MAIANTEELRKYKYGTTMLVKQQTKDRISKSLQHKQESYDTILNRIIDNSDKWEAFSKLQEYTKLIERLKREKKIPS